MNPKTFSRTTSQPNPCPPAPVWHSAAALFLLSVACGPLSAGPSATNAPRRVEGTVFLDANGNGKLDPGEKGIADVRITDSVQFTRTGPDGRYTIDVSDDPLFPYKPAQVVSVSWPSGKWPTGRWWARLDQAADHGKVNFGLRDDKQPDSFMFAHITDDHSFGGVVANWGKYFPLMAETVKFVFETGDLGYAVRDTAEQMFTGIVSNGLTLPVPIFYVGGNHDYVGIHDPKWTTADPLFGGGAWTKHLGPTRWSFDYAGRHFVGIDWVTPQGDKLECGIPPIALEFLKRDIELAPAGSDLFVFAHYPDVPAGLLNPQKFREVGVFGGHSHSYALWGDGRNTFFTTQIALWGAGGCGLVHTGTNGVQLLSRCAGCKWGDWVGMARTGNHLNLCPLHNFAFVLWPQAEKAHIEVGKVTDKPLSAAETIDLGKLEKSAQVEVELDRGNAREVGVKFDGDKQAVVLSWDGTWLACDGIRVPMPLREWEKTVRVRAIAGGGVIRMQVNGMYEFSRPLPAAAIKVAAYANGGTATIKTFTAWRFDTADPGKPAQK